MEKAERTVSWYPLSLGFRVNKRQTIITIIWSNVVKYKNNFNNNNRSNNFFLLQGYPGMCNLLDGLVALGCIML